MMHSTNARKHDTLTLTLLREDPPPTAKTQRVKTVSTYSCHVCSQPCLPENLRHQQRGKSESASSYPFYACLQTYLPEDLYHQQQGEPKRERAAMPSVHGQTHAFQRTSTINNNAERTAVIGYPFHACLQVCLPDRAPPPSETMQKAKP